MNKCHSGQPRRVGDRAPTQRRRGTSARHSSAARAVGQSAQAIGSPGTQLNGQSRPRAGAEVVEAAHFCGAGNGPVDKELLANSQPILVALQQKIAALTVQLQSAASPNQPRGLGKMTSLVIDPEIGDWNRFNNRREVASYTGLCPGEYSNGNTRLQSCVTKHGNPRLRAALWNWPGGWSASSPITTRCASGARSWPKAHWPLEPRAKKRS